MLLPEWLDVIYLQFTSIGQGVSRKNRKRGKYNTTSVGSCDPNSFFRFKGSRPWSVYYRDTRLDELERFVDFPSVEMTRLNAGCGFHQKNRPINVALILLNF